jgi:hypothetical protein
MSINNETSDLKYLNSSGCYYHVFFAMNKYTMHTGTSERNFIIVHVCVTDVCLEAYVNTKTYFIQVTF